MGDIGAASLDGFMLIVTDFDIESGSTAFEWGNFSGGPIGLSSRFRFFFFSCRLSSDDRRGLLDELLLPLDVANELVVLDDFFNWSF